MPEEEEYREIENLFVRTKMAVEVDTLCLLAQPREGQFKNKKQPELTENRTVWKSYNQADKEETFIQTGRRGRDRHQGGEDSRGCGGT